MNPRFKSMGKNGANGRNRRRNLANSIDQVGGRVGGAQTSRQPRGGVESMRPDLRQKSLRKASLRKYNNDDLND